MSLCLLAVGVFVFSGLAALATSRRAELSVAVGSAGAVVGSVLGIVAAARVLLGAGPRTLRAGEKIASVAELGTRRRYPRSSGYAGPLRRCASST